MNRFFYLIILVLFSCSNENTNQNDLLIKYEYKFLMDADKKVEQYFVNRDEFIKPYISYKQHKEVLEITTAFIVNACAPVNASIEIREDTLWLKAESDYSGESCNSDELRLFRYYIKNPQKKKYVVIY